jgi:hypothetical protein
MFPPKPKLRVIDDPNDRELVRALMCLRIDDVAQLPTPKLEAEDPPIDACNPNEPPPYEAESTLIAGSEADNEEFHLPFVKTVEVFDFDDPDGDTRICHLTDSDEQGSESESDERLGMYPSESSDGCEDGSGSDGRCSDDDF